MRYQVGYEYAKAFVVTLETDNPEIAQAEAAKIKGGLWIDVKAQKEPKNDVSTPPISD